MAEHGDHSWLVDGMNVVGSRPDGWWRDRDGAARRLADELAAFAAATGDEVTVVFDGRPPRAAPPVGEGAVAVRWGAHADDEIVGLVAEAPEPSSFTVVTSDADLTRRVREHGARVTGAGRFRRRLDAQAEPGGAEHARRVRGRPAG